MNFCFTFGTTHQFKNNWVEITAESLEKATATFEALLGRTWAGRYIKESEWVPSMLKHYPDGCLVKINCDAPQGIKYASMVIINQVELLKRVDNLRIQLRIIVDAIGSPLQDDWDDALYLAGRRLEFAERNVDLAIQDLKTGG